MFTDTEISFGCAKIIHLNTSFCRSATFYFESGHEIISKAVLFLIHSTARGSFITAAMNFNQKLITG